MTEDEFRTRMQLLGLRTRVNYPHWPAPNHTYCVASVLRQHSVGPAQGNVVVTVFAATVGRAAAQIDWQALHAEVCQALQEEEEAA